jgi:hypothetical protein
VLLQRKPRSPIHRQLLCQRAASATHRRKHR